MICKVLRATILAGFCLVGMAPSYAATAASGAPAASSIDPAACRALVKHTPDANVAYQPGVDVNGHAVAPADVAGSPQIQMPKTLTIPLAVQLAKIINLDTTRYPFNQLGQGTEGEIGVLTVTGDHVLFNGQPISDDQQSNLAVLCMKANQ